MRVAVIAPPWLPVPPDAYGGTEQVLDVLCRHLRSGGHDVLLVTTGDSTCPVEMRHVFPRSLGTEAATPAAEMHYVVEAYRHVEDWVADVVHDHTLLGLLYGTYRVVAPIVTTNHGPFSGHLRAVYRAAAHRVPIIAVSAAQASTAGDIPVRSIIHHGVDTTGFPLGAGDGGYAAVLARMHTSKGIPFAIRVARAAGIPLRIAAKMRERVELDYFTQRVKPLLGGEVEYVGEVGGGDKRALLAGAFCLLNPIVWAEPFGLAMIEALACGTPVVATPRGAVSEIVDHGVTGYVCGTTKALAGAVTRVSALSRRACREVAEAKFSAARMTADHVALFESSLHRAGRGSHPLKATLFGRAGHRVPRP